MDGELEITTAKGIFRGRLVALPRVGESLIIYRIAQGDIIKTSVVRRVTTERDGSLRVQTMNTIYHVARAAGPAVDQAA